MFAIRFHTDNEEHVMDWIHDNAKDWFVVRETDATRSHYQGIIKSEKTIKALRDSIRRTFTELTGNKGYSLKECNEGFINYLCKGPSKEHQEDPIVIADTFVSNVMERHSAWWDANRLMEKRKKLTVLQELLEWHKDHPDATRPQLGHRACEIVLERNQTVRQIIVKSWVDSCWFKMHKNLKWLEDL